ncbi:MAG: segregation/condensation protein A [Candidatus Omnitrophica bacterium]|nr:segregation/condensation protein A [Candidatus Omnitrophota bacterium]MBU1128162.1 segregation/condensation protein A [Candidatus Omnitrophota bacterium]MBU1656953.1 segregation/condensation protein A [Candidatus Omnitrophota bacterium]MBU1785084.1 segregation/condensation protein A [Candidatus Omnitrophota bacterium]MBU1851479.1 segregation/condensation protein A [Candidatus Omnitrophota bacterium]
MSYKVKLNFFEGPLDLLLFLIKKERIDVYDIPISRITEQYLAYMELLQLLDLDIAGEFLVMAATLMHIKSRMLLPPDESQEDEVGEEDPRDELVRKLLEYKKYKEAASCLQEMRDASKEIFLRTGKDGNEKIFAEENGDYFEASLFDLISAFRKVLKDIPKHTFHNVIKDKVTVADKIHAIYHILAEQEKVFFSALFTGAADKDEVIATFLAVLELIKMREVIVLQKGSFGEIEILRNPELAKQG